jgi:hypothetical protein
MGVGMRGQAGTGVRGATEEEEEDVVLDTETGIEGRPRFGGWEKENGLSWEKDLPTGFQMGEAGGEEEVDGEMVVVVGVGVVVEADWSTGDVWALSSSISEPKGEEAEKDGATEIIPREGESGDGKSKEDARVETHAFSFSCCTPSSEDSSP